MTKFFLLTCLIFSCGEKGGEISQKENKKNIVVLVAFLVISFFSCSGEEKPRLITFQRASVDGSFLRYKLFFIVSDSTEIQSLIKNDEVLKVFTLKYWDNFFVVNPREFECFATNISNTKNRISNTESEETIHSKIMSEGWVLVKYYYNDGRDTTINLMIDDFDAVFKECMMKNNKFISEDYQKIESVLKEKHLVR